MTFGQLAFYDTFKTMLLATGVFHDNPVTHFSASIGAAGVATCMTQPFDVMKTRLMNAPPGKYSVSQSSPLSTPCLAEMDLLFSLFFAALGTGCMWCRCDANWSPRFLQGSRSRFHPSRSANRVNIYFLRTVKAELWLHSWGTGQTKGISVNISSLV